MMTMWRRSRRGAVALSAAALLLGGLGTSAGAADSYTLRYSDLGPPRGPRAEAMIGWADTLAERSGGRIKVKFFWSQSLVKAKATLKAVGSGLADAGTVLGVYTPAALPTWNLANAPFGIADPWVGMRTWHAMRQEVPDLNRETDRAGVHILANFTSGPVDLLSRDPVTSLEALKGLKVRATGGWTALLTSMQATPVRIGFGEVYQALDRGTVDATTSYIPFVLSYKHYEVARHLTEVRMGQVLGYGLGINKRLWAGMPDDLRRILTETSDELMDRYAEKYLASVADVREKLEAGIDGRKVTFHRLTEAERAAWKAHADGFVAQWREKAEARGVDADGVLAALDRLRTAYEAELQAKGYPWQR